MLYKLHYITLTRLEKVDSMRVPMEKIFEKAHPEYNKGIITPLANQEEIKEQIKKGIAKGLGYLAKQNYDLVMEFVKATFYCIHFDHIFILNYHL